MIVCLCWHQEHALVVFWNMIKTEHLRMRFPTNGIQFWCPCCSLYHFKMYIDSYHKWWDSVQGSLFQHHKDNINMFRDGHLFDIHYRHCFAIILTLLWWTHWESYGPSFGIFFLELNERAPPQYQGNIP